MLFIIASLEAWWDVLNDIHSEIQGIVKVLRIPSPGKSDGGWL